VPSANKVDESQTPDDDGAKTANDEKVDLGSSGEKTKGTRSA
jgi:hypothetical protein